MFKHKKKIIFGLIIAAIAGGIWYQKSKAPKVEYTTTEASRGTLAETVSVTGKVAAPQELDLAFKLSGQVRTLLVDVGDRVSEKQKIATIDSGTLFNQLAQAREQINVEKRTLAHMKRQKVSFKQEEEDAQRAKIRKAEDAAREIATQIGYTSLYSPIAGTVIRKNVEVGEITVANAVTDNTSVVTIAADGDLEIKVDVPESDIVNIKVGQNANVTLDAFPEEETLGASVSKIDPASTVIQDVVYYKVTLKFKAQDTRLKNGMSADVDINVAEKNNVVSIPERAVKTEGSQKYVEILKPDNMTERVNISTGLKGDDGMVEVVSGLHGGEKIITLKKDV